MQLHQRAVLRIVHIVHFDTANRGSMGRSIDPRFAWSIAGTYYYIQQQERRQLRPKGGWSGEANRTKSINIFRAVSPRANIFQQKNPLRERICSLKAVDFGLSRKQLTLVVLTKATPSCSAIFVLHMSQSFAFFFFFFLGWGNLGKQPKGRSVWPELAAFEAIE